MRLPYRAAHEYTSLTALYILQFLVAFDTLQTSSEYPAKDTQERKPVTYIIIWI